MAADESVAPGHYVWTGHGYSPDAIRRFSLPWCLIATQDAYASGSRKDQLSARSWVDRTFGDPSEMERVVAGRAYIASELLIALRYMGGDSAAL
jgi:hypothetical protein